MGILIENEIIIKPINEIKPYLKNPRVNQQTVDLLVKIIPKVGFNVPLVIDSKGVIVKGHARYSAALKLGMDALPCIVTHASAKAIKADRLTDNKIQEFTTWDTAMLKEEVGDVDFDSLGLDVADFGLAEDVNLDIMHESEIDAGEVQDNREKPVSVVIHFKNADEFRDNEEEIRAFLDSYESVDVRVGADGES